jgi:DNA-binding protein H-NS
MRQSKLDALQLIEDEFINNSEYLRLKQELEAKKAEEQKKVVEVIQSLINAFEIDPAQFCGGGKVRKSGSVAPKYRNTVTGQTWTGRGRAPVSYRENPEQWVEI